MSTWKEKCMPIVKNWSEPLKTNMLNALAIENELAESLGFECEPDGRRGYGWCMFLTKNTRVWSLYCGWARVDILDGYTLVNHRYFLTLEDALKDNNSVPKTKIINYH